MSGGLTNRLRGARPHDAPQRAGAPHSSERPPSDHYRRQWRRIQPPPGCACSDNSRATVSQPAPAGRAAPAPSRAGNARTYTQVVVPAYYVHTVAGAARAHKTHVRHAMPRTRRAMGWRDLPRKARGGRAQRAVGWPLTPAPYPGTGSRVFARLRRSQGRSDGRPPDHRVRCHSARLAPCARCPSRT